jgi:Concanavalin A-like lectin/glucanases superfamily
MRNKLAAFTLVSGLCLIGASGCGGLAVDGEDDAEFGTTWEALMADGDVGAIAPSLPVAAPRPAQPTAGCEGCGSQPLAFWTLDDCNAQSTELADSAYTGQTSHPAFRAVSAACAPGVSGQGVRLSGKEDVVYAPDQPDFSFEQGLTVAAFIQPDRLRGTQSILRKRFDASSSFVLALENRQLSFVVRLDNGRLAGVSAPIEAGRFSHVAATYDGKQVRLYVDGVLAAKARASGKIARGAGPIFIGNDADGRQFKGNVDEIWLDDRAASAETIQGLTCIHRPPALSLTPLESAPQVAGDSVHYELSITNQNDAACPTEEFAFFPSLPYGLTSDTYGSMAAAPGETVHAGVDVRSSKSAAAGSYPFQVYVYDQSSYQASAIADATFVVGTGPISCDGAPPYTAQLTGSPYTPVGGFAIYSAPGLVPPDVTQLMSSDGVLQGLRVDANPGTPTDPGNSWFGVNLFLSNPSCVDASAYSGVQFTVTGDLGSCGLALEAVTAQDNQVAFGGACTQEICFGPLSAPLTTGTHVVRFADMTGGVPMPTVDPTALQGIQWALNTPNDGGPCVASFTITDVSFVSDRRE